LPVYEPEREKQKERETERERERERESAFLKYTVELHVASFQVQDVS